ncbi:hypothetical protein NM688_g6450 [Phlebia brevispora]|uniref:Uncharacterized protein n=1 Tax=Phlebia brevispora TaxID=194682 RepID=A0ACC1SFV4_9APHY|nr:hypothetical protein NM688_g6450 [Phlebia brevispora]
MSADDNEERRQLADIQNQLQRARQAMGTAPSAMRLRKDALEKLIALVHSPYSSLKSIAAGNIKWFIKEARDLEDDAINAVYDLCEDQDPRVRKDGYRAITQVSREQKKWVKRNADSPCAGGVTLAIQSSHGLPMDKLTSRTDEPEEVEVVEQQLTEHLDMDPKVTLGVLCDQIVPPEDAVDDEDQAIRDRLRSLVLGFMVGRAKRAIVERHAGVAEKVFAEGLMKTMFKLPPADINIIVKDIVLSLPSYSRYSQHGDELLDIVLVEAKASVKSEELSPQTKTRQYLSLAAYLAIEKRVARPTNLLQFYCQNFASRIVLLKFTEEMRVFVIENFANALSSLQENAPKMATPSAEEVIHLRNNTIDACPGLFAVGIFIVIQFIGTDTTQVFTELPNAQHKPWQACKTLLQACARRKTESAWTPPGTLSPLLQKIESQAEAQEDDKDLMQEVTNLIRSLVDQPKASPKPRSSPMPPPAPISSTNNVAAKGMTTSNKLNGGVVLIKRKREDSSTSQRQPAASNQAQANHIRRSTADRERKESSQDARARSQTAPTPGSSSRSTPAAEQGPPIETQERSGRRGVGAHAFE